MGDQDMECTDHEASLNWKFQNSHKEINSNTMSETRSIDARLQNQSLQDNGGS